MSIFINKNLNNVKFNFTYPKVSNTIENSYTESEPKHTPEHKPEHKSESKPEHKPESKSKSKPESKPEHKSKSEHKSEHKPESESKPEIKLVIILGPLGYGKTNLANKLENDNMIHLDGDILDLNKDDVLNLKAERNVYTKSKVNEIILDGKVPIISCGGGIFISRKTKFTFLHELATVFPGYKFSYSLFVPNDMNSYDDIERLKSVLEFRENRDNKKYDFNLFNKICKNNKKICQNIVAQVSDNDNVNIVTYPNWDIPFTIPSCILDLKNAPISTSPIFFQHRILTKVNDRFFHITVEYNRKCVEYTGKVEYRKNINATKIIYGKMSLIILQDEMFSDKLNSYSHITLNPGPHNAKEMKNFTIQYNQKNPVITLPDKKEKQICYKVSDLVIEQISIRLHDSFYC